jgi:NADH-quinone oxidoreductase subunit J
MGPMQLIFIILAVVVLIAAVLVVTTKYMVHAALWLILALFGVGGLYVLLNAGFFAVAQVLIYIGAIAILFIFAVMLTRRVMQDSGPNINSNWWLAGLIAVMFFSALFWMFRGWDMFSMTMPAIPDETGTIAQLGQALVSPDAYLLPFEMASVLLVAAMIGAIYIAYIKKQSAS